MKKNGIIIITIFFVTLFFLGSCKALNGRGDNRSDIRSGKQSDGQTSSEKEETIAIKGELFDFSFMEELAQKDNSKDLYSATTRALLQIEQPEGAIEGGANLYYLGNNNALHYKKHLFDDYKKCWDEAVVANQSGESKTVTFPIEEYFDELGEVLGTDHFIATRCEYKAKESDRYCYSFFELDENLQIVKQFDTDFLDDCSEFIDEIMIDENGYWHVITEGIEAIEDGICTIPELWTYYVLNPSGEVIYRMHEDGYCVKRLNIVCGGQVAVEMYENNPGVKKEKVYTELRVYDKDFGEVKLFKTVEENFNTHYLFYTFLDENTFLYVNSDGVYRKNLSDDKTEALYFWIHHGLKVTDVRLLQAENEKILLICKAGGLDMYLVLEPTKEKMEMWEITLAVSPMMKPIYENAAFEFNKKYPTCNIVLKDNYDSAALLTELIAGKGPVLIDTTLTGFTQPKKLWEPLDGSLEQLGMKQELVEEAMRIGQIDGNIYGIVTDFSISTVVTAEQDIEDWDYDSFMKKIKENPNLKAVTNSNSLDDRWFFLICFMIQGQEDNYFWNAKKEQMEFQTKKFGECMDIGEKYCIYDERVLPGKLSPHGSVLCNTVRIERPEQLGLYRMVYGEDIKYIGYPSATGSKHYLEGNSPLTVRKTATKEEKTIAMAFIQMLLSYESQKASCTDPNFSLSVRKDVLEEQVESVNENTLVYAIGFEQVALGKHVDNEADKKKLYELLGKASAKQYLPRELLSILNEELEQYYSCEITKKMLIDHLENRVGLYYMEQK